ncbi:AAA family ATPase [Methylocystis echinoides]|uniref:AAA family ATPase n=1 Tax=Methylocystis echinoides TaxID=29468 RepID=UPI00341EF7CC
MNAPPAYFEAIFKIAQLSPGLRADAIAEASIGFAFDQQRIERDVDEFLRTQEKIKDRAGGNGKASGAFDPRNPFYDPDHRSDLTLAAWRKRELPPRDFLLGELLSTASRMLIIGETGVGKTLLALDMAAAIASGREFLGWEGRRKARVMYLDGELSQETFQERLNIVADRYGEDIALFAYSREYLTTNNPEEMPAFNTPQGQEWLLREIEKVKPDLIVFDAIMSLMIGNMSEEESWSPMKELIREITRRRVAQIWLHHTGHDANRGYGTKTREWEMDTVAILTKIETDADPSEVLAALKMEFTKARLRNGTNYQQFATKVIHDTADGFVYRDETTSYQTERPKNENETIRREFMRAYDRLAAKVEATDGNGAWVNKVEVNAIREELRRNGYLETDEKKGQVTSTARSKLHRAKMELLNNKALEEKDGWVWRPLDPMDPACPM